MSPRTSPRHSPSASPVQSLRHLQDPTPPPRKESPQAAIDPALSDPRPPPPPPNSHVHFSYHPPPPPPYYVDRWQQQQHPAPNFAPAVFHQPHQHHHHRYPELDGRGMPHRVDSNDRSGPISHRPEDRAPYDHPGSHPSPPPIATLHNPPTPSGSSENVASPSPPVSTTSAYHPYPSAYGHQIQQSAYYQNPPNGPPMHHAQPYPYPPHARYPVDPATGQVPPGGYAPNAHYAASPPYIIHTDDAATKLNDRVRRKCYNCRTTDTSTWRRSSLTPGKVLCNKCGLFERTHSRPRPEQFPHKRGPIVTNTFKTSRSPPPASRLPPMSHMQPLPPHHYDHPSIAPLVPRADGQGPPPPPGQYAPGPAPANGSPHMGMMPPPQPGSSQQQQQQSAPPQANQSPAQAPAQVPAQSTETSEGSVSAPPTNSLKRPRSPSPDRSPRQEHRSPPFAYRTAQGAAASTSS